MPIDTSSFSGHRDKAGVVPALRAENVHKTLGTHPVLRGVSLRGISA